MRHRDRRRPGLLPVVGLGLLLLSSSAVRADGGEASVTGFVTKGDERYELTSVAVLREGPVVVLVLTDDRIPEGRARALVDDLLEGSGLVGVKIGIAEPGSELSEEAPVPLFVQFLPGDGSFRYDSGPTPGYELETETMTPERITGRIHGTIVATPEQIDVDANFDVPLQ